MNAACMTKEALSDIVCAKSATFNAIHHQAWYEYSTSDVHHSIVLVNYENAVEDYYRPD